MGILSSGPGLPNIPYNQKSGPETTDSVEEKSTPDNEKEVTAYLDKKRGTVGTITTSWQGLLEEGETKPKRKTLLGE